MSRMSPGFASARLAQCDLPIATLRYNSVSDSASASSASTLANCCCRKKKTETQIVLDCPKPAGSRGQAAVVLCGGWGNGKLHVVCCHVLCRRWLYKSVQKLPAKSAAAIQRAVAARRPTTTRRDASGAAPGQLCGVWCGFNAKCLPGLDWVQNAAARDYCQVRAEIYVCSLWMRGIVNLKWNNRTNSQTSSCCFFFFTAIPINIRHCNIDILSNR